MLIVSTIRLMLDLSVFCVPRPCLYMLGSSTPVVFERKNLSHPIITWCFETTNLRNGAQLGEILSWNFNEGHLIYYRRSKQIRCINMINITCNQIVTWYGHHHFAPLDLHLRGSMIIIVTGMTPWSPSSWSPLSRLHEVVSSTITSTTTANG